ncbi:MAG: undecaprenyl-diphosphate phosphatase [Deltaproteobacteria bacterium]|nr:undecaprenyl-diphosphate phosphatase [Deltaproteobacteria bacterium]
MSMIFAIFLGILQGVTEFLPVSSSGHLVVLEKYFSMTPSITINVFLHLGTLGAIVFYYWKDLSELIRVFFRFPFFNPEKKSRESDLILMLLLSTFITGILALLMKNTMEKLFTYHFSWLVLAGTFSVTAIMLIVSTGIQSGQKEINWNIAVILGIVQGLAVMPGISRSGFTICAALILGVKPAEAARYSFLMAVPAIAGAGILEARHLSSISDPVPLAAGVLISALAGFLSLSFLVRLVEKGKIRFFAWYLFPLAVFCIYCFVR